MPINNGFSVGGEIGWDVIISVATSLIIGVIAFTNMKNKVKQLSDTVEYLDNNMSDINIEFKKDLNIKNEEFNTRITLLENHIEDFKSIITKIESLHNTEIEKIKTFINDLKVEINTAFKEKTNEFDNRIEKILDLINQTIDHKISSIENHIYREIDIIKSNSENIVKTIFKRIDELKDKIEKQGSEQIELKLNLEKLTQVIEIKRESVLHLLKILERDIKDLDKELDKLEADIDNIRSMVIKSE